MQGLSDEDRVRFLNDWRQFAKDFARAWEDCVMAGALGENPPPLRLTTELFHRANSRLVAAPTDPVSNAWLRYFVGVSQAEIDDEVLEDYENEIWNE
jgi:hypothetical protein